MAADNFLFFFALSFFKSHNILVKNIFNFLFKFIKIENRQLMIEELFRNLFFYSVGFTDSLELMSIL
jgi:hypothetical protein